MMLHKIYMFLAWALVNQFKFFAAHDSDEYALQVGATATPLDPTQAHGRLRVAHFKYASTSPAINDTLNLINMPAGKVRVLDINIEHSAFAAGATLDVGYSAYTDHDTRVAVVADANAFVADAALDNTTDIRQIVDTVVDSANGWTLTGLVKVAAGTTETFSGWITYVVD